MARDLFAELHRLPFRRPSAPPPIEEESISPALRLLPLRRHTGLPGPGAPGLQIVGLGPDRLGLRIQNIGIGEVIIGPDARLDNGWQLGPGESLHWPAPYAPQHELFAVGSAGHDLRIWEEFRA